MLLDTSGSVRACVTTPQAGDWCGMYLDKGGAAWNDSNLVKHQTTKGAKCSLESFIITIPAFYLSHVSCPTYVVYMKLPLSGVSTLKLAYLTPLSAVVLLGLDALHHFLLLVPFLIRSVCFCFCFFIKVNRRCTINISFIHIHQIIRVGYISYIPCRAASLKW